MPYLTENAVVMIAMLIASLVLVLTAFALLSLRILFVKNGTFRGTCAGNSIFLKKEGVTCGVCGRQPGEPCAQEKTKSIA